MSGCLCCNTDYLTLPVNETTTLQQVTQTTETTETTLEQIETTTTVVTETTQTTETTGTTLPAEGIAACLKKKGVNSDEVVFLYTTSCCGPLERTVNQIGSYNFKKCELGISITSNTKDILSCLELTISDVKDMQAAQFWCPASGEQMIVTKDQFIGARENITSFAARCKESAKG